MLRKAAAFFIAFGFLAASESKEETKRALAESDTTADLLLAALKKWDFSAATARFDSTMKAALSQDKLATLWAAQTAKLGKLSSWTIVQRTQSSGNDVRVALLKFERGELQALISIHPQTQEIAGLFFKPVPKAVAAAAPYVDDSAFR